MKKIKILFALLFTISLIPISIKANDEESNIYNYETITITSDLSNKQETDKKVQEVFDKYGNNVIVEVNDINNKTITSNTRATGKWVTNKKRFYVGHIIYSTQGTIKCFVAGNKISTCSGVVENAIHGNFKMTKKEIQKNNTKQASLYWELSFYASGSKPAVLGYRTPLYN